MGRSHGWWEVSPWGYQISRFGDEVQQWEARLAPSHDARRESTTSRLASAAIRESVEGDASSARSESHPVSSKNPSHSVLHAKKQIVRVSDKGALTLAENPLKTAFNMFLSFLSQIRQFTGSSHNCNRMFSCSFSYFYWVQQREICIKSYTKTDWRELDRRKHVLSDVLSCARVEMQRFRENRFTHHHVRINDSFLLKMEIAPVSKSSSEGRKWRNVRYFWWAVKEIKTFDEECQPWPLTLLPGYAVLLSAAVTRSRRLFCGLHRPQRLWGLYSIYNFNN